MKKIICIVGTCILSLLLAACGGPIQTDTLQYYDFLLHSRISLPFLCEYYGGTYTDFITELTLPEIAAAFQSIQYPACEIVQQDDTYLLLHISTEQGIAQAFIHSKEISGQASDKNCYNIGPLSCSVLGTNNEYKTATIYWPRHIAAEDTSLQILQSGQSYSITGSFQDFADFYSAVAMAKRR